VELTGPDSRNTRARTVLSILVPSSHPFALLSSTLAPLGPSFVLLTFRRVVWMTFTNIQNAMPPIIKWYHLRRPPLTHSENFQCDVSPRFSIYSPLPLQPHQTGSLGSFDGRTCMLPHLYLGYFSKRKAVFLKWLRGRPPRHVFRSGGVGFFCFLPLLFL
jgi:hypothetical protein